MLQLLDFRQSIIDSDKVHSEIWHIAMEQMNKNPNSISAGLFVQSLNEIIDIHSKRIVISQYRGIPITIWIMLSLVSIFAMIGIGYQSGLSGSRSIMSTLMLVLAFSIVMFMIADLDRPSRGLLKAKPWALIKLQEQISK